MNEKILDGKVAVITGGTSGLGAATAELMVGRGAKVVIAGRREHEGQALAAKLGSDVSFIKTDVAAERDVEAMIAHAVKTFGRLDILFNNAGHGGAAPGGLAEFDLDRLRSIMDVHVGGTLLGMKYAARVMSKQGSGSIINMSSMNARFGGWSSLDYSAAKAAIVQLTRSAAVELGELGIRVNSIAPGPILTGIFGKAAGMDAAIADRTAAGLEQAFVTALENFQPLRRAGQPRDIAEAAVWLASDASSFVTGHNLVVDGGISAGRPISVANAERAGLAKAFAELH